MTPAKRKGPGERLRGIEKDSRPAVLQGGGPYSPSIIQKEELIDS